MSRRKRLIGQRSCISDYGCALCRWPRCSAARTHPGVANGDGGGGVSGRRRTCHESRADERPTLAPADAAEAVSIVPYRGQAAAQFHSAMHLCSGLCRHRLVRVGSARGRWQLGCRDRASPRPAGIGALAVATKEDVWCGGRCLGVCARLRRRATVTAAFADMWGAAPELLNGLYLYSASPQPQLSSERGCNREP